MCGIAGYFSTKGFFRQDQIKVMTDRLQHRGPDSGGEFHDGPCSLGHRRLSIIDLSTRASQPMYSSDDRYVIVYNGEVYNYREIGARFGKITQGTSDFAFKSSSDTEVLLEAFAKYGPDFVQELNGMFAFAIFDRNQNELYLYRDRLGIKPLYYYWDGKNFAFASELKSLTSLEQIPLEINHSAINRYLHFGYVPAPYSIYKNIYKMNSGTMMKISATGMETKKYWSIHNKISSNLIERDDQALVKISDLMISSVQYQLKSDVPFGVFLSGGIDSSLISAQATMLSSIKVNTFSIGFEENSHNESEYAKAVANYLGTSHHEFIISYKDALKLIDTITDTYDEPFADSSCIPTMLVSKLASQYVRVTLSGEGGDELFFGYGAYVWANRLSNPIINLLRKPASNVLGRMSSRYQRIARLLDYDNPRSLRSHIFSQEQYLFAEKEIPGLLKNHTDVEISESEAFFSGNYKRLVTGTDVEGGIDVQERRLKAIELQALYDVENYLQDDLLTKVDRASMKYSIETRVPYLDHRIVEMALNISPNLKYRNGISKYILKKVLYQYVPKHLFDKPKQGFAIPLNKWLQTSLKYLIDHYLSEDTVNKYGVLEFSAVKACRDAYFAGSEFMYNRLWQLIVLQMWLEKFHSGKR
ncbi:MAG: asparagine synthase (glutamine-hydrolyzing) [Arcticibacter sp.]